MVERPEGMSWWNRPTNERRLDTNGFWKINDLTILQPFPQSKYSPSDPSDCYTARVMHSENGSSV